MLMRAAPPGVGDPLVRELVQGVEAAGDGAAARDAFRQGFERLRWRLPLYPAPNRRASLVFESAAATARELAAACLPLGVAVAMHLYPLCVLQCIPLPRLSFARFQRAMLLRAIRNRGLILANAGGERARGAAPTVLASLDGQGLRVEGTFEYVSLASVADLVLYRAPLADGRSALCAAELRAGSVHLGPWKFSGGMRLSDTRAVTFAGHRVPHGRFVIVPDGPALRCTAEYQRSWFHLFLAEVYLARLARLQSSWDLPRPAEQVLSLNELAQLRAYALRLLDDFTCGADVEPLRQATSAIKLRVSLMAQSAMAALRAREGAAGQARQLGADAAELGYIKWQPTADETILSSLGLPPEPARRWPGRSLSDP